MDLAAFRIRFPEFRTASDELVEAVLAEASTRLGEEAFGDAYAIAVGYMAADILVSSPYGNNLRLDADGKKKAATQYRDGLNRLRAERIVKSFVT